MKIIILQENRPKVIATNTHYFYIGILVDLWYKKIFKKLVLKLYPKRTIIQKLNIDYNNNNNNNNGFNIGPQSHSSPTNIIYTF